MDKQWYLDRVKGEAEAGRIENALFYVSAAISEASTIKLRVKQMEWVSKFTTPLGVFHATADLDGVDRYVIFVRSEDGLATLSRSKSIDCGTYGSLDEAKAVAQVDFEARIFSILENDRDN